MSEENAQQKDDEKQDVKDVKTTDVQEATSRKTCPREYFEDKDAQKKNAKEKDVSSRRNAREKDVKEKEALEKCCWKMPRGIRSLG